MASVVEETATPLEVNEDAVVGQPDGDDLISHQAEAGSIQAIDRESVHRICSGQVVLTLATAVKELVENSIDAGATTVDIKLKEYGSDSIEVTDNGSGVEEKNFAGLTQKHHTSKLSDFSDLIKVETFGFRGEALSSLCALSNMTISTRHKSVAVGTKLEYDGNGVIVSKTPVPRQILLSTEFLFTKYNQGTTVTMQNLFHTLPVRHKEFQRNLKKDFSKMVQVLNAYCIVNTGVRITCSNQTNKGSRSTVVSTNGNATVRDNISNLFGPKQLLSLLPFEQCSPSEDVCTDYGIKSNASNSDLFRIEGFVSKCEHGQGRSTTDRQFLFINRRPCDAAKILKVINEVYHSYNRHQYPFVTLLVTMAKESVDVNVTPDKRQIFMEGEKILLATIKTSLTRMYEPTTSVLRMNTFCHKPVSGSNDTVKGSASSNDENLPVFGRDSQSPQLKLSASQQDTKDGGILSSLARLKRSFSSAFDKSDRNSLSSPSPVAPGDKQRKLETFLTKSCSSPARFSPDKGAITQFFSSSLSPSLRKNPQDSDTSNKLCDSADIPMNQADSSAESDLHRLGSCSGNVQQTDDEQSGTVEDVTQDTDECQSVKVVFHELNENMHPVVGEKSPSHNRTVIVDSQNEKNSQVKAPALVSRDSGFDEGEFGSCETVSVKSQENWTQGSAVGGSCHSLSTEVTTDTVGSSSQQPSHQEDEECILVGDETSDDARDGESKPASLSVTFTQLDKDVCEDRPESLLPFSFQKLKECLSSTGNSESEGEMSRSFRAAIRPADNKTAEEELQREISKDMFAKMDVLGQFNLGFIIAKNGEDLFIVDQHATDEKYNFEMLQRHTVIQSQQLIHPQGLELTASNEVILMDNLDIFRKNGFDFVIDENAPPTQRVKLKSTPVSKNWTFGKDDIEELIFMLTDSPGIMCRPSRVRMMFASRACRKSIMIGTHLNKGEMKKLLCHMGEIEQPWNCPHGRPTMRHLVNLNMLPQ